MGLWVSPLATPHNLAGLLAERGLRCKKQFPAMVRSLDDTAAERHDDRNVAVRRILDTTMDELPIACTLTPEALRTRREGLLTDLVRRSERRDDLPDRPVDGGRALPAVDVQDHVAHPGPGHRKRLVAQTVYRPVRRGSAVAETVERLGRAIGMGLLRPGDGLPPESRRVLAFMPVHVAAQPWPDSVGASIEDECKARIDAIARRHNATVIDWRIASPITREDRNYWDPLHYRLPVARLFARQLVDAAVHGREAEDGSYVIRVREPAARPKESPKE